MGGDRGIGLAAPAADGTDAVCCGGTPCDGELSNMPSKSSGWQDRGKKRNRAGVREGIRGKQGLGGTDGRESSKKTQQ